MSLISSPRAWILAAICGLAIPAVSPLGGAMPSVFAFAAALILSVAAFFSLGHSWQRLVLAALAGLYWSVGGTAAKLESRLPERLDRCDWRLSGEVTGLPRRSVDSQRFALRVAAGDLLYCPGEEQAERTRRGEAPPSLVLLRHYRGRQAVHSGQQLTLRVRLRSPRGRVGPGIFDYESYLLAKGYAATGYVRAIEASSDPPMPTIGSFREALSLFIESRQNLRHSAFIQTLLIGDQRQVTDAQWETLRRTGTVHLLVVSGLHVGIMALLGGLVGGMLWLPLRRGERVRWTALGAIFFAFSYSALAGFALSTSRALVAVVIFSLSGLLARHIPLFDRFFGSLLVILLLDPLAPLSDGFWLSFGAVAALLMATSWRRRSGRFAIVGDLARAQLAITVLITPLLLWRTGEVAIWSPVVNFFATPWLSLVALPSLLLSFVLSASGIWENALILGDWSLRVLWGGLNLVTSLPGNITLPFQGGALWLCFFGALLLVAPLGPWLWRPALLLWGLGLFRVEAPDPPFQLLVLDVGQGLSVLMRVGNETLAYDTGPAYPGGYNSVRDALLPALRELGWGPVTRVIISHGDADHARALGALREAFPAAEVISGEVERLLDTGPIRPCKRMTWETPGLRFEVRQPEFATSEANDRSCTLHVTAEDWSLLIAGDISLRSENVWLAQPGQRKALILVAPHHGSAGSGGEEFLTAVEPDWVLYSAGWRNRFDHPQEENCRRARRQGATLLSTARHGALLFSLGGPEPQAILWRCQASSWWRTGDRADCLRQGYKPLGLVNPCP